MKSTLDYNIRKVQKGIARIIGQFNVFEPGELGDIRRTFKAYEKRNIRTNHVSFQLSINPAPDRHDEALSDGEAVSLGKKIMDGLGYGHQPIIVFEHHDIKRVHYHIVSIRVSEKGKKISDSYEKEKLQKLMGQYAKEYHFIIGNKDIKQSIAPLHEDGKTPKPSLQRFEPEKGNMRQQIIELMTEALTYEFTTMTQFLTIMKAKGLNVEFNGTEDSLKMSFRGLDSRGNMVTPLITENDLEKQYYEMVCGGMMASTMRAEHGRAQKAALTRYRKRISYILNFCIKAAKTEGHFENMLQKKGITISLSRTSEGFIFGATVVDHLSKRAYKLSELDKSILLTVKSLGQPNGAWEINERKYREQWVQLKRAEWQEAHIQRNMDLAAKQTVTILPKWENRIGSRDPLPGEMNYITAALCRLTKELSQAFSIAKKENHARRNRGYKLR